VSILALAAIPEGVPLFQASSTKTSCYLTPIPLRVMRHGPAAAPHIRNRNGTSSNWGGYAAATSLASPQRNSVSAVRGSWTIPAVSSSGSSSTYSSFWVGIDGYSDGTVEQIGTEQDWTPSGQQNYVWFEMYPHGGYEITGFPIEAGDEFGAGVTYIGGGTFILGITNFTRGTAYTVPTRYTQMKRAQRSSAEWIVEAPYSGGVLPLADFGKAAFSHCTATVNGTSGPINNTGYWQDDPISMESTAGVLKARPSALTDSTSSGTTTSAFTIQWYHE